jgi:uncharacterized membrane protein
MGITSGGYKLLLLLHILAVIIGLGTVALNGLYGRETRQRRGKEGLAIAEATEFVSGIAQYVIYLIPVFGILLVFASDKVYSMSDAWISASLALFVVALGISHGVLGPNFRKMLGLMRELEAGPPAGAPPTGPPPQVAELERRGRTVGMAGASLNILLVVLTALMIWKPGG